MECAPAPSTQSGSFQGEIVCGEIFDGTTIDGVNNVGGSAREVHYTFTVPSGTVGDRTLTFSTCGSQFDTILRLFHGDDLRQQFTSCDDCGTCGNRATLTRTFPAGNYSVVIEGFDGVSGQYKLEMLCGANNTVPSTRVPGITVGGRNSGGSKERRGIGWLVVLFIIGLGLMILGGVFMLKASVARREQRRVVAAQLEAGGYLGQLRRGVPAEVPPPYIDDADSGILAPSPNYALENQSPSESPLVEPPSFEDALSDGGSASAASGNGRSHSRLDSRSSSVSVLHKDVDEPDEAPPEYLEVTGVNGIDEESITASSM
jgi:hypothetical protein